MSKKGLFEYAVLFHGKTTKVMQEQGIEPESKMLVDVTRVFARAPNEVAIIAAKKIPDEFLDKLDQVEIVIRPF